MVGEPFVGSAMGWLWKQKATALRWQAPSGRTPAHKIVAVLDWHRVPSKGLFGMRRSPSLVGWLPNPIEIEATVVHADPGFTGEVVRLTAPKSGLPALRPKQTIALALLAEDVCICVSEVPADVAAKGRDALAAWLASWTACKK